MEKRFCAYCASEIRREMHFAMCDTCHAVVHINCAHSFGGKCPTFGCSGKVIIYPERIHIVVSGSSAKDVELVARSLLTQTQNQQVDHHKWDVWITGGFYLVSIISIGTLFLVMANFVPLIALPIVIIGSLLSLSIVGAFQLRQDESLSQKNFLSLMLMVFRQIPFLRKSGEEKKTKTDVDS